MPQNKRELTIALILGSSVQGIDKQLPNQSHVLGGRALYQLLLQGIARCRASTSTPDVADKKMAHAPTRPFI